MTSNTRNAFDVNFTSCFDVFGPWHFHVFKTSTDWRTYGEKWPNTDVKITSSCLPVIDVFYIASLLLTYPQHVQYDDDEERNATNKRGDVR